MKKKQEKWRSPSLGKDMQINIYGHSGTPIVGLPTRGQKAGQWEKYGMVDALFKQLENGYNQLFCIDSIDDETFLNDALPPRRRLMRHQHFEAYILEEVIPFVRQHNAIPFLMIAGVDLGGYHAVNFALKHPNKFDKAIGISGLYDIKHFFGGFYNDTVYYNNPTDFIPNLNKQPLLNAIQSVDFRLVSYANDDRRNVALRLSKTFRTKLIEHKLDVWDSTTENEWELWTQMIATHII